MRIGIMIEGQEGLTWARWQRLAQAVEDAGYESLFRSDHLTGLFGHAERASLDTWASLTWLASATKRLRFGPMVCPLTFYHPALLARRAAAVADLSGGRLELGIGAGWHEGEHAMYGIAFPGLKERLDRLECGARAIGALWTGKKVTLEQPYYPLVHAESYPLPPRGRVPLIIGGRGEKRTLRIVAEHADEWNVTRVTFDEYVGKRAVLERHCAAVTRDPNTIARSLMVPVIYGRTAAETEARQAKAKTIFPRIPDDAAAWRTAGFLYGAADDIVRDLERWQSLGVHRVLLQMLDMEDLAAIEAIGRDILPAVR